MRGSQVIQYGLKYPCLYNVQYHLHEECLTFPVKGVAVVLPWFFLGTLIWQKIKPKLLDGLAPFGASWSGSVLVIVLQILGPNLPVLVVHMSMPLF